MAYLVEVDVHTLELKIRRAIVPVLHQYLLVSLKCCPNVHAGTVKSMLAGDGLPEGSAYLVALHICQLHISLLLQYATHTHWPV